MAKGERGTAKPYLTKRSRFWQIKYYVPGEDKPRYESSGSEDKNVAIKLLRKRMREADERQVTPGDATMSNLFQLHLDDMERNKRVDRCSVDGFVRNHLGPAFGKIEPAKMTSAMVNSFIKIKQKAELSNATINRMLSALRRSFKLGQEALPPLVIIYPKITLLEEDNVREGFLEHPEYQRLRDELPSMHQKMILVIGYHLGMRLGEILTLRWEQVDWEEGYIRLKKRQTKGKQARNAPLYGDLRAWLQMAASDPDRGLTIVACKGRSIKEVKTAWGHACIRAGVPGLLRHDLRRTAIRNMIRAGISEKRAMLISGHKDPNMLRRYDITSEADTREDGLKLQLYQDRKKAESQKVVVQEVGLGRNDFSGEVVN